MFKVILIRDIVNNPYHAIFTAEFRGYEYGVARVLERNTKEYEEYVQNQENPAFNSYDGFYEFSATCTTLQAAEAACRLLNS